MPHEKIRKRIPKVGGIHRLGALAAGKRLKIKESGRGNMPIPEKKRSWGS